MYVPLVNCMQFASRASSSSERGCRTSHAPFKGLGHGCELHGTTAPSGVTVTRPLST